MTEVKKGKFVSVYAIRRTEGTEVQLNSFLASEVDGG